MSLLDDASSFMKDRTPIAPISEETIDLDNLAEREKLIAFLRTEYENATFNEIERALNQMAETLEKPYARTVFLKKIRSKLED